MKIEFSINNSGNTVVNLVELTALELESIRMALGCYIHEAGTKDKYLKTVEILDEKLDKIKLKPRQ